MPCVLPEVSGGALGHTGSWTGWAPFARFYMIFLCREDLNCWPASPRWGWGAKTFQGLLRNSWCAGPKEQPGLGGGNCLVKPRADWPSSAWHVACCHPLFHSWGTGPVQASSQLQALPGSSTALGMKQRKSGRDSSPSHQAACESGVGPAEHALLPSLSQLCSTESNNTWLQQG